MAAEGKLFSKKEWSWIMYDWANSIYATNIMAAIYPTIFASQVEGGDIRWGYATSAATLIVALLAPVLGALADYKGMKKKLFTLFMLIGVVFTPLMVFTGHWQIALIGYVISRIGFSGSCLFYDSFLTDVTTDERMDKVSSWGYAMGYIGGSTIPFVISIAILLLCDYSPFAMTFSVLIVSVWWLLFSIPMLKNVTHEHYVDKPERLTLRSIFSGVLATFRRICTNRGLLLFILAYFFYIDGVDTVISISTAYGATLGLGATGMILALLVTQIVAVPCSILFARLADRFSARKALIGAVCVYLVVCLVGFYMGYTLEPAQAACDEVFDGIYAAEQVPEEYMDAARSVVEDVKNIRLEGKDELYSYLIPPSEEELSSLSKEEAFKFAFAPAADAAAKAGTDRIQAFGDAIRFSTILFWLMAALVGTVQGGIQAVSRSYFGKLIPKERSNEYYGFFDIFGKFASFLGPVIYSTVAAVSGRSSYGVLGLALLFLAGLALLLSGKEHFHLLEKHGVKE